MPAPALASSFRQQANAQGYDAAGKGGYGGYSYQSQQDQQGSSGGGAFRNAGEADYGQENGNSNVDYSRGGSSTPVNGPHSSQAGSGYAPRMQNYQQQQSANRRPSHEDAQSSFGGSAYMGPGPSGMSAPNGLTSPTGNNPSASSAGAVNGAATGAGGPSSSSSNAKPATPEDIENSRRIARVHFEEFRAYLDAEGQRDPNARANAREKLTRLTRPQFQELSTDVYDELMRRQRANNAAPGTAPEYLPQKPDFHPKRNQARQKLSTLPKTRFRDLASDVYFELERRYPEFREPEVPLDSRSTDGNFNSQSMNGAGGYGHQQGQSQQQLPPRSASRNEGGNLLQLASTQRRPQFPNGNPAEGGQYQNQSSSATAANEVIIPNKSRVIEEDVSLPASTGAPAGPSGNAARGYGNYATGNASGGVARRPSDRTGDASGTSHEREPDSPGNLSQGDARSRPSNETTRSASAGNSNLTQPTSPQWNSSFPRASEASSLGTRLIGGYGNSATPSESGLREWESDEMDKIKSDYEYKIATMQSKMQGLEKDLRDAQSASQRAAGDALKAKSLENELEKLRQRHDDTLANVDQLEQDLADAQREKAERDRAPAFDAAASSADKEEISRLQRDLKTANDRFNTQVEATDNLKNEIEGLVDTLKEMNLHQDELVNGRDADQARIAELAEEVKDWKSRYETAKTELRDLKATSQLFVKPTKADDDYMPTSPSGAILDSHVTRFQSSIDDLLISGRSDAPSSVIIATKQVINAVARIDEDVQEYQGAGLADSLAPDDRERLLALKSKCNATLSNLTTAARNHATGHGLSPVSLLDAAASHLSNTIIELVRLLLLRKAGTPLPSSGSSMKPSESQSSSLSSNRHLRSPSTTSVNTQGTRAFPARIASLKRQDDDNQSVNSIQRSSSNTGRQSPASSMHRLQETDDYSHSRSQESSIPRNDHSFGSLSGTPIEPQAGMNASTSNTSLASNFHADPRRNAVQRQQYGQVSQTFERQPSVRSQASSASYRAHEGEDSHRPDFGEDNEYRQSDEEVDEHTARQGQSGSDDPEAWADLKNYLESQTEAIVHSITALLAAIRGGAQPAKLQENLSQIITIVSSIVEILRDNLPSNLHHESEPVIQELSQNCQKLIELQDSADGPQGFSKQTKQAMATASFGVAKSLKSINGLLASV